MAINVDESGNDPMEANFDFDSLSLDSNEDKFDKAISQVHADSRPAIHDELTNLLILPPDQETPLQDQEATLQDPIAEAGTQPVSQPWGKLPSSDERNPYLPGINAEQLDAMANNPNHIFKNTSIAPPTSDQGGNIDTEVLSTPTFQFGKSLLSLDTPSSIPIIEKKTAHNMTDGWTGDPSWLLPPSPPTSALFELADAPEITSTHFGVSPIFSYGNLPKSRVIGQQLTTYDADSKTIQQPSLSDGDSSLPTFFQGRRNAEPSAVGQGYELSEEHDIERANNALPSIAASKSFAPAQYQHDDIQH